MFWIAMYILHGYSTTFAETLIVYEELPEIYQAGRTVLYLQVCYFNTTSQNN